ncbi:MAG: hypothetical protein ACREP0_09740 [Rhodanobacteraceae bacterium]
MALALRATGLAVVRSGILPPQSGSVADEAGDGPGMTSCMRGHAAIWRTNRFVGTNVSSAIQIRSVLACDTLKPGTAVAGVARTCIGSTSAHVLHGATPSNALDPGSAYVPVLAGMSSF